MTMVQMEINEEEMKKETTISEYLPELGDEEKRAAVCNKIKVYILNNMDLLNGQYWFDGGTGLNLQRVDRMTLRVVSAWGALPVYNTLAKIILCCKELGIEVQMEPYTVIIPYEPEERAEVPPVQEPGLEVA